MNTQKTLTIALATLGLFGVAGAAFLANGGRATASEPLVIRSSMSGDSLMRQISDVPTDAATSTKAQDGSDCDGLVAEDQQAGPRGGGQMGGGQQGGPGGGQMGGPGQGMRQGGPQGPMILRDPKVQQELKLSEDQMARIQQALDELRPQRQVGGPGGEPGQGGPGGGGGFGGGQQGGPGGQQGGGFGGGQQGNPGGQQGGGGFGGGQQRQPGGPGGPGGQMGEEVKKFEEKLKTILNQSQFNRYQQLSLQSAGPNAFNRPDVAEKLGLTEEQREEMRAIMEANRPEPPQPPQGGGGGLGEPPQPPNLQEMKAKQEALMNKLIAVLNSQQKSTWQSMVGAKFEFTQGQPRQNGGGGGFGGGRPGGGGGNGGGESTTEDASVVF